MQSNSAKLGCEKLEDRDVPAAFVVNNQLDMHIPGKMNLREALNAANLAVNPLGWVDTIEFSAAAFNPDGSWLTVVTSALPQITDGVIIDGLVGGMDRPIIQVAVGAQERVFDVVLLRGEAESFGEVQFVGNLRRQHGRRRRRDPVGGGEPHSVRLPHHWVRGRRQRRRDLRHGSEHRERQYFGFHEGPREHRRTQRRGDRCHRYITHRE